MELKDICEYINFGKNNDGNLFITKIKQSPDRCFISGQHYTEEQVQEALGTTSRISTTSDYGLHEILYLASCEYDHFPYHFLINGRKFKAERQGPGMYIRDTDSDELLPTSLIFSDWKLEFIDINGSLEEIIRNLRPKHNILGQAFRYNKLLISNGFSPEEFPWIIDKGDIMDMISLDKYSLSEIDLSEEGALYERDGKMYVIHEKTLVLRESGEKAIFELGYTKIV